MMAVCDSFGSDTEPIDELLQRGVAGSFGRSGKLPAATAQDGEGGRESGR